MTHVYETQGNLTRSIKVDNDLFFPNVQTCVAVVAVFGGYMAGAHVTLHDRSRLPAIAEALRAALGGAGTVYAVGPIGPYDLSGLGEVHTLTTPGFVEIRATLGVSVELWIRPTGGGDWQRLDGSLFS
jgi:hypothetical protein